MIFCVDFNRYFFLEEADYQYVDVMREADRETEYSWQSIEMIYWTKIEIELEVRDCMIYLLSIT